MYIILDFCLLTSTSTISNCLSNPLRQPPMPFLVEKSKEEIFATWYPLDFKFKPRSAKVNMSSTVSIFSANIDIKSQYSSFKSIVTNNCEPNRHQMVNFNQFFHQHIAY